MEGITHDIYNFTRKEIHYSWTNDIEFDKVFELYPWKKDDIIIIVTHLEFVRQLSTSSIHDPKEKIMEKMGYPFDFYDMPDKIHEWKVL